MYSFLRIKKFKRGDVLPVLREAQRTPAIHYKKGVDFDNNIDWTKTANNVLIALVTTTTKAIAMATVLSVLVRETALSVLVQTTTIRMRSIA